LRGETYHIAPETRSQPLTDALNWPHHPPWLTAGTACGRIRPRSGRAIIADYLYGGKQDQAHRRQRRRLHRLASQRTATDRLPGVDGSVQKGHPAFTKNVGTQHRRLWLYRYTYESGRTGEAPLAGFAIRGRELVVYLVPRGVEQGSLLSKLGKHRMSKSCLYFEQLADLDRSALERLVVGSVAEVRRRYRQDDPRASG
jgi:hypothetical protein